MVKALVKFNGTSQFGQVLPFSQPDKFFQRLVNKIFLGSGPADRKGFFQQIIIYYNISSHYLPPIDFQIINFTRIEGEIQVSRTELYVVENFD